MENKESLYLNMFRKSIENFVPLTDEEWAVFAEHLYIKHLKKKELFAPYGKVCTEVGLICEGSVRFYFIKDGMEITNYFSFEGEFASSYRSFLQQTPSHISIEALTDTMVVCFSFKGMQAMMADQCIGQKTERFRRMVAEYLICCYEDRLMSFITQKPEERYMSLLQTAGNTLQRIPQHYIATFLGVTPVSLSRIRKRIVAHPHRANVNFS